MPRQARDVDKLAVVRSRSAPPTSIRFDGDDRLHRNNNRVQHRPSFGSVIRETRTGGRRCAAVRQPPRMAVDMNPAFGVAHRPFTPDGAGLSNLHASVPQTRTTDRQRRFVVARTYRAATTTLRRSRAWTRSRRGLDMVASGTVRRALDLSNEDPRTPRPLPRRRAAPDARRPVEAGVGCITLATAVGTRTPTTSPRCRQLPELDRGIANLIQDLHDRGMQDDVVTVCWANGSPSAHQRRPRSLGSRMSAMIAGGGLKMGQAIASTSRGETPRDRRDPSAGSRHHLRGASASIRRRRS